MGGSRRSVERLVRRSVRRLRAVAMVHFSSSPEPRNPRCASSARTTARSQYSRFRLCYKTYGFHTAIDRAYRVGPCPGSALFDGISCLTTSYRSGCCKTCCRAAIAARCQPLMVRPFPSIIAVNEYRIGDSYLTCFTVRRSIGCSAVPVTGSVAARICADRRGCTPSQLEAKDRHGSGCSEEEDHHQYLDGQDEEGRAHHTARRL